MSAKAQILDSFCAGSYVKMATAISLLTISKYNGGGQARAAEVAAEAWVKVGEGTPFVFEHKPNLHGTIDLFVTFYRQRRERRHDGSGRYARAPVVAKTLICWTADDVAMTSTKSSFLGAAVRGRL